MPSAAAPVEPQTLEKTCIKFQKEAKTKRMKQIKYIIS